MTAIEALRVANDHKARRFAFKQELLAEPAPQARAMLADAILTAPAWLASHNHTADMLTWCPGIGDTKAEEWVQRAGILDHRPLRRLTDRQRRVLAGLLHRQPTTTRTSMTPGDTDG